MTETGAVRTMATIGMNYRPAIAETERFMKTIQNANNSVLKLQAMAGKGIQAPIHGMSREIQQSGVILDRYGKVLSTAGMQTQQVAAATQTATRAAEKHATSVRSMAKSYDVLGSQWERRISWFIAGAGFYGGIRAIQNAVAAFSDVESSMIVIQRTVNDTAADFGAMRDELVQAGIDFGHTWDTVQQAAIRWAQAGYEVNEIVELTRQSLLALNVAEMDVEMATQGLIAIMAQWGFEATQLEAVIDKLNITSDNYAVTTGDLVAALQRASGAATALGLSFEETVGLITAMRVASGRLGAEVGNALNTILTYITRQSTLNKLMEAGVEVFADAAQTRLRPAMEILVDIAERWSDNAEAMPMQLVEIAEEMGVMSEEMAEMIGLQEEWTQMQQLEVEASIAGVRRRNFLIALLKNFAQAQEVVVNMHDSEGYSMEQNVQTMTVLEKQYQQLRMSATQLAIALGEAGLLGQIKSIVEGTTDAIQWFNSLDSGLQSLILTFAQLTLGIKVFGAVMKMAGIGAGAGLLTGLATPLAGGKAMSTALMAISAPLVAMKNILMGIVGALGGPVAAALIGTGALIATMTIQIQKANEEYERNLMLAHTFASEYDELNRVLETNTRDSAEYKAAIEGIADVNRTIAEQFPHLIQGYDNQTESIIVNTNALREMADEYERLQESREAERTNLEELLAQYEKQAQANEAEAQRIEQNANSLSALAHRYAELSETQRQSSDITRVLISLIGEEGYARLQAAGFTSEAIRQEVQRLKEKAEATRNATVQALRLYRQETENHIRQTKARIDSINTEIQALSRLLEARQTVAGVMGRGMGAAHAGAIDVRMPGLQRDLLAETRAYEDALRELRRIDDEIARLMATTPSAAPDATGGAVVDNLGEVAKAAGAVKSAFDLARESLERMNRFGVLTTQELIDALKELARIQSLAADEQLWVQEQLFSAYRDLLKEEQKLIEEAYRERLKLIDDERDAKIAALQAEIDALDEKAELEKREEEHKKHLEKIQELEDKLRYHELRTGREHELAIIDTKKAIEDEYLRWKKQQEDWARQDKKDALRQEIQDTRDRAEEEKNIWQEMYEAMLEEFSDHNINLLALAATYDEQWLEDGLSKAQQWARGFREGSVNDLTLLMGELEAMAKAFRASSFFPDVFGMHGGAGTTGTGGTSTAPRTPAPTVPQYSDPADPRGLGYVDGASGAGKRSTAGWSPTAVSLYNDGYNIGLADARRSGYSRHEGGIVGQVLHAGGVSGGVRNPDTNFLDQLFNEKLKANEIYTKLLAGEFVINPDISMGTFRRNMATFATGVQSAELLQRFDILIALIKSADLGKHISFNHPLIGEAKYDDKADIEFHAREMKRMIDQI